MRREKADDARMVDRRQHRRGWAAERAKPRSNLFLKPEVKVKGFGIF
jgi:hypothetical protein